MSEIRPMKWVVIGAGALFGIAHIGLLGYVVNKPKQPEIPQVPTINIPRGTPYSSYKVEASKEGYRIEYKANDPAILESHRSLDLNQEKKGIFGGKSEQRTETRYDQYTMDGTRNIGGGATTEEGKSAKDIQCIVADAGARSQGAMAGSAIAAGVAVPAVASIPYVGWLPWLGIASGMKAGSELGSQVGTVFNDC